MAGFNFQNFIIPASNRVHLFSVILAVILFGAFRLSGGRLDFENKNHPEKPPVENAESESANNAIQQHAPIAPSANSPAIQHRPMVSTHPAQQHRPMPMVSGKHPPAQHHRPMASSGHPQGAVTRPFSADSMPGNSGYTKRRDNIDIDNVINTPAHSATQQKKKRNALDDIESTLGIHMETF